MKKKITRYVVRPNKKVYEYDGIRDFKAEREIKKTPYDPKRIQIFGGNHYNRAFRKDPIVILDGTSDQGIITIFMEGKQIKFSCMYLDPLLIALMELTQSELTCLPKKVGPKKKIKEK